jgi:OmcA/MtrC family decaheme c-type cytochrome
MVGVQRGLLIMMAAGAIALGPSTLKVVPPDGSAPVSGEADNPTAVSYQVTDKEFYLAADTVSYVRPGLVVKINSVTDMAPGKKPIVDLNITDDFGNPLDRTGATTPGVITLRFVPAVWDATAFSYKNLIVSGGNPSRDNTGTWTTLDIGHYTYKFNATLPTFDPNMPMTLFCGGNRNVVDYIGKTYYVQAFKDFVPATGAAATTWGATTTAACNQCHDPLALHGGNYREAKTCALCHNPVNMTGSNAEFNGRLFFHQIHASLNEEIGEITYPQLIQQCATCHDPKAANGNTWATMPGMVACGSCHVGINWTTGEGHDGGPQTNDSQCASCHPSTQTAEWDTSVPGAHLLPSNSTQLQGLNLAIVEMTNNAKGQNPTVKFKLTDNKGNAIKPSSATGGASVSLVISGNTKDYALVAPISQTATAAAYDTATGVCTYTFTVPTGQTSVIPSNATGTWTLSASSRRTVTLTKAVGGTISYTEGAMNPIYDFSVDGSDVVARRVVVDLAKCNACHYRLATTFSHGGQRIAIQFCVMCHAPNASDATRRPADGSANPAESIQFARMIHRIHTGEELTQIYTVYGFSGAPTPFNEVTYPGDRRNCIRCHTNIGTAGLPTAPGTLPTITLRDYFTPQGPGTTACTGCHDNRDTLAHAYLNTATFPGSTAPAEACGTCHNANGEWSTTKVHAR